MTNDLQLVLIDQDGHVNLDVELSGIALEMCGANLQNYKANGFMLPWVAYLAMQNGKIVGMCAFKSPPILNRVEIAYFTFPEFEGHGIATNMAKKLIYLANHTNPNIQVFAQTLPENNASTCILSKLGFVKTKEFAHPEDGNVWEWELKV